MYHSTISAGYVFLVCGIWHSCLSLHCIVLVISNSLLYFRLSSMVFWDLLLLSIFFHDNAHPIMTLLVSFMAVSSQCLTDLHYFSDKTVSLCSGLNFSPIISYSTFIVWHVSYSGTVKTWVNWRPFLSYQFFILLVLFLTSFSLYCFIKKC